VARVVIRLEAIEAGELKLVSEAHLKKALRRLRDNPTVGKALVDELAGCRSIRVGGVENRIVYRHDIERDMVEVLAIERRRDDKVYKLAKKRLEA
jgi:mRNA-degrading endonuclease RelE of RelBE toxin-antitoxin system